MTRTDVAYKPYHRFVNGFCIGLLCCLIAIICSCNRQQHDTLSYSEEFKPILDTASKILTAHPGQGMRYLDSAAKKNARYLNVPDQFRIYSLHFMAASKGDHDSKLALSFADSMLHFIERTPNKKFYYSLYGEANFAKGDALFDLGRYSESYFYFYNGYLIGKTNLSDCTLSSYTYRMGMISYKQAHYKLAVAYWKESFKDGECGEDFAAFYRQQEVLDNIALAYKNAGVPDSALIYFDKATAYIKGHTKEFNNYSNMLDISSAVIYGNKAEVLTLKGDYNGAADLLKKSIAINEKKGNDNIDAALSEIKLGKIYLAEDKDAESLLLIDKIKAKLDSLNDDGVESGWNLLAGNYYRKHHDFAKAMNYLDTYHALKDSISERNRPLRESDISDRLSSIEKQYQIENLQTKQRISVYVALIFATMAIIIILLIRRNWQRSKKELFTVNNLNKQINEQKVSLENTLHELENSSQEKDRILRTVAHDLRNPLGGIASLTNSMVEDQAEYTSEQLDLLKIIQETSYNSLELINEILEATNSMSTELNRQLVDINTLVNNSVELLRFKAAEKNQKIILSLLAEPEELLISKEKIWRVISNLISNAIKFSPTGGVIKVNIDMDEHNVLMSVNDHGIGIPESMHDKVFNMFTDAKRPGTLGEKSFGLGLSICMQIVEKHGGKIWFQSDQANGTTFYVRLSREKNLAVGKVVGFSR